jgi:pseudaminic acid synthase
MTDSIRIHGRAVGRGEPVYIIAELSANHHQEYAQAEELVRAAAGAGADCVKLQTYTPDTMTIRSADRCFQIMGDTPWKGRNLYDLYAEAYTPWEWQPALKRLAQDLGMHLFSTPFDAGSVEFLAGMDVPAYKIASFELIDLELIALAARQGKPVILSTGMATLEEIEEAVRVVRDNGNDQVALLKCTSAYPAPYREMNLRTIPDLAERFHVPVGLSDHSPGIIAPVAAVAQGACIIEKHLTLSRARGGPDSSFSLEPAEFHEMVKAVRTTEAALGTVSYAVTEHEEPGRALRRSLFAVEDIAKGEEFTKENIRSIRPDCGLPPRHYRQILGRKAARYLPRGTPLQWDDVAREQ